MNQVILSIGSNIKSRSKHIIRACELIKKNLGTITKKSNVYLTPPIGFESETSFYNCCLFVETKFNPNEVLLITQEIEKDLGRTEKTQNSGYQSRTIDIDIIFFNHEVLDTPKLTIPHALFRERRFVLEPLNDLANQYVDPISYLTVEQLLRNCSDKSKLTILENQFLNTL